MMKLMVQCGKKPPFHPTLRLRDTPYARGHWQQMIFRPNCFGGASTIREMNLAQAIAHYFSELKRLGHVVVQPPASE